MFEPVWGLCLIQTAESGTDIVGIVVRVGGDRCSVRVTLAPLFSATFGLRHPMLTSAPRMESVNRSSMTLSHGLLFHENLILEHWNASVRRMTRPSV